jgi:hypothetical protein
VSQLVVESSGAVELEERSAGRRKYPYMGGDDEGYVRALARSSLGELWPAPTLFPFLGCERQGHRFKGHSLYVGDACTGVGNLT